MFVLISYPSSKSINILHLNILSLSVATEIEPTILWSLDNGSHMWHSTSKSINIFFSIWSHWYLQQLESTPHLRIMTLMVLWLHLCHWPISKHSFSRYFVSLRASGDWNRSLNLRIMRQLVYQCATRTGKSLNILFLAILSLLVPAAVGIEPSILGS